MNVSVLPGDSFCSLTPQQTRFQAALLIQQLYGCQSFPSYFTASHLHKGVAGRVLTTEKEQERTYSPHPPEAQQKQASLFSPGSSLGHGAMWLETRAGAAGGWHIYSFVQELKNRGTLTCCNRMAYPVPLGTEEQLGSPLLVD